MQFGEKLVSLRRKVGLTQAELADAVSVSRQAVSKWELGTAIPDLENILALSKKFSVSIDYLVNDAMESELDSPTLRAATTIHTMNLRYVITKVLIAICIISIISIVGVVTRSFVSMAICLSIIGVIFLIYTIVKMVLMFLSKKK